MHGLHWTVTERGRHRHPNPACPPAPAVPGRGPSPADDLDAPAADRAGGRVRRGARRDDRPQGPVHQRRPVLPDPAGAGARARPGAALRAGLPAVRGGDPAVREPARRRALAAAGAVLHADDRRRPVPGLRPRAERRAAGLAVDGVGAVVRPGARRRRPRALLRAADAAVPDLAGAARALLPRGRRPGRRLARRRRSSSSSSRPRRRGAPRRSACCRTWSRSGPRRPPRRPSTRRARSSPTWSCRTRTPPCRRCTPRTRC